MSIPPIPKATIRRFLDCVDAAAGAAARLQMKSDIADRLRKWAAVVPVPPAAQAMNEAADEIERLRITPEEQAALESAIAYHAFDGQRETLERMLDRICPGEEKD